MKWIETDKKQLIEDFHKFSSIKDLSIKYGRSENAIRLQLSGNTRKFYEKSRGG